MGFSCTKCGHQIGGGMTHCAFCGSRQERKQAKLRGAQSKIGSIKDGE